MLHINIPACVRESVAVLVCWAVVVLDAVDLLAAAVVGVALVDALRARALADVVPLKNKNGRPFQDHPRSLFFWFPAFPVICFPLSQF